MPPRLLPPEILDLIVDLLRDEPDALKACCLASKSWLHRARKRLFARVDFFYFDLELWKKAFPDPSNSPAHYTRNLTISTSEALASVGWIRAFSGLVRLQMGVCLCESHRGAFSPLDGSGGKISLVPLRGLSPTLKSLYLSHGSCISSSEIFGLVCSFPLLEDLSLVLPSSIEDDRGNIPSTSPRLTGCLDLDITDKIRPVVHRLLELPRGLHFSKVSMTYVDDDVELMMDLVSKCSDTLEYLGIYYYTGAFFCLSASVVG